MKILFMIIIVIIIGSFIFAKLNNHSSLFAGTKDFLRWLAYFLGWKPDCNYNLVLSYDEADTWVTDLKKLLLDPDLLGCLVNELDGILILNVDYISFSYLIKDKSDIDREKTIIRSLSRFYRKQRNISVDRGKLFFQSFTDENFELWVPLNQHGIDLIAKLRKERKQKKKVQN